MLAHFSSNVFQPILFLSIWHLTSCSVTAGFISTNFGHKCTKPSPSCHTSHKGHTEVNKLKHSQIFIRLVSSYALMRQTESQLHFLGQKSTKGQYRARWFKKRKPTFGGHFEILPGGNYFSVYILFLRKVVNKSWEKMQK